MRIILTHPLPVASLTLALGIALSGCAGEEKPDVYQDSMLEELPFVYRMTVQQGNVITEEMVDALEPGLSKHQVRYLLGTPLLSDFFHSDRWDYTYTMQRGHRPMEVKRLTLFFQDDALVRVEGDMRPDASRAATREPREIVVEVPDNEGSKGFFRRSLEAVGLED